MLYYDFHVRKSPMLPLVIITYGEPGNEAMPFSKVIVGDVNNYFKEVKQTLLCKSTLAPCCSNLSTTSTCPF